MTKKDQRNQHIKLENTAGVGSIEGVISSNNDYGLSIQGDGGKWEFGVPKILWDTESVDELINELNEIN